MEVGAAHREVGAAVWSRLALRPRAVLPMAIKGWVLGLITALHPWIAVCASGPLTLQQCSEDLDHWKTGWADEKKEWCCKHAGKACFDCSEELDNWESSWSDEKQHWCCAHEKSGCSKSSPKFDCKWDSAKSWTSAEEEDWCCEHQNICYDCNTDSEDWVKTWSVAHKMWCCKHDSKACYDCSFGLKAANLWPPAKKSWCCRSEHKGCLTDEIVMPAANEHSGHKLYRCESPMEFWSKQKQEWCCKSKRRGCPEEPYSCSQGQDDWQKAWSPAKKDWCCQNQRVACGEELYQCHQGFAALWPDGKRSYCCKQHHLACGGPYDCDLDADDWDHVWGEDKQRYCCEHANRGCDKSCEVECTFNGLAATCQERIGWAANHRFVKYADGCAEAFKVTQQECPVCSKCTLAKSQCLQKGHEKTKTNASNVDVDSYDCQAGLSNWTESWTEAKQIHCCIHQQLGCIIPPDAQQIDPYTCKEPNETSWHEGQKFWCCLHKQTACSDLNRPYDCDHGNSSAWPSHKQAWCTSMWRVQKEAGEEAQKEKADAEHLLTMKEAEAKELARQKNKRAMKLAWELANRKSHEAEAWRQAQMTEFADDAVQHSRQAHAESFDAELALARAEGKVEASDYRFHMTFGSDQIKAKKDLEIAKAQVAHCILEVREAEDTAKLAAAVEQSWLQTKKDKHRAFRLEEKLAELTASASFARFMRHTASLSSRKFTAHVLSHQAGKLASQAHDIADRNFALAQSETQALEWTHLNERLDAAVHQVHEAQEKTAAMALALAKAAGRVEAAAEIMSKSVEMAKSELPALAVLLTKRSSAAHKAYKEATADVQRLKREAFEAEDLADVSVTYLNALREAKAAAAATKENPHVFSGSNSTTLRLPNALSRVQELRVALKQAQVKAWARMAEQTAEEAKSKAKAAALAVAAAQGVAEAMAEAKADSKGAKARFEAQKALVKATAKVVELQRKTKTQLELSTLATAVHEDVKMVIVSEASAEQAAKDLAKAKVFFLTPNPPVIGAKVMKRRMNSGTQAEATAATQIEEEALSFVQNLTRWALERDKAAHEAKTKGRMDFDKLHQAQVRERLGKVALDTKLAIERSKELRAALNKAVAEEEVAHKAAVSETDNEAIAQAEANHKRAKDRVNVLSALLVKIHAEAVSSGEAHKALQAAVNARGNATVAAEALAKAKPGDDAKQAIDVVAKAEIAAAFEEAKAKAAEEAKAQAHINVKVELAAERSSAAAANVRAIASALGNERSDRSDWAKTFASFSDLAAIQLKQSIKADAEAKAESEALRLAMTEDEVASETALATTGAEAKREAKASLTAAHDKAVKLLERASRAAKAAGLAEGRAEMTDALAQEAAKYANVTLPAEQISFQQLVDTSPSAVSSVPSVLNNAVAAVLAAVVAGSLALVAVRRMRPSVPGRLLVASEPELFL